MQSVNRLWKPLRPAPALCLIACGIHLGGCKVTEDYKSPTTSTPAEFIGLDPSITGAAHATQPVAGGADVARWWEILGDPTLSSLVVRAQTKNLDLAQAQARIRQARASRGVTESSLLPTFDASGSASRSRSGGNGRASTGNFFRAGFDAAWEIDVFGGTQRRIEAADAGIVSAVESQRNVLVTLTAEVASTYALLRGTQEQLEIARRNLNSQLETLKLTQDRHEGGFVGALDVANAESQVASTRSRIPSLEGTIRTSIYALSVLLGEEPAALNPELLPPGTLLIAPTTVPVGLPSELLQRRPDIRRAEADLRAATALVGAAVADLYPKFSLSGSAGLQNASISDLADIANRYWSIGPSIRWPVFDGGRTRATIEVQKAAAEESLASYKKTVLIALSDVETALVNLMSEQERGIALTDSARASREAVALAMDLYTSGKTDFLNVLSAQSRLDSAEDAVSASRRTVVTNLIALYKALGGGWSEANGSNAAGAAN